MKMSKIFLILGASSDLGIELIKNIAWETDDVILAHYHSSANKLMDLKRYIQCEIIPIQADFLDIEATRKFLDEVKAVGKIPTHIVHLPSISIENKRFKELEWKDYESYIDVQLRPIVYVLKEFLPLMAKCKYGKIAFVLTSGVLNVPPKFLSDYVTAKYALLGFMKSIAVEYAGKGITINAVSPSMIETDFLCKVNDKVVESVAFNHPMKRNANVQDVVPVMRYLLSDESNYMTGVNIPVTGGENF